MNIVDRRGFLYVTRLPKHNGMCEVYGTDINISHLIHEFGHACASQKEEFMQDTDGNYTNNVGACAIRCIVDRENKTVKEEKYNNLFIEEALNTIEEENILCDLLGIEYVYFLDNSKFTPMQKLDNVFT